jgi:arylsulfatase
MADMTDKAMAWVSQQKALAPDKPFFVYFAPGATHAPHHVPKEWADKYKGKFDSGWDKLREATLARQKVLGVVPEDCQLTARHAEIPAWDDMPEALKPILRRQMEVYAGFSENVGSHCSCRTCNTACWISLSTTQGTPSFLTPPSGLGISTRLTGWGW